MSSDHHFMTIYVNESGYNSKDQVEMCLKEHIPVMFLTDGGVYGEGSSNGCGCL